MGRSPENDLTPPGGTMFYRKFPHAPNFEFPSSVSGKRHTFRSGDRTLRLEMTEPACNVFRLTATGGTWTHNESELEVYPDGAPETERSGIRGGLSPNPLSLEWTDARGRLRLRTVPGRAFGVCGESFLMAFELEGDENVYGMGEKFLGFELSRIRTKFWNTDVMGDFPPEVFVDGRPDPAYVSIPYVLMRTRHGWVGILVNNPGEVAIDTGADMSVEGFLSSGGSGHSLQISATAGQPDLFFLFGDTPAEVTQSLQTLVGATPLPPVWALGYHQCRWGYASARELAAYKDRFAKEGVPVDGLWLDIDYMRGYRVFTFDDTHFPNPEENLAALQADGQKVVPIIDPGVKIDPDWEVYRDGEAKNVFCQNPQGKTFVGRVWPGDTAFVDYSRPEGRGWWRDRVAALAERGLHGCWNDMNDPSLGHVDSTPMRWDHGRKPHWTYHNQFAAGMARATREGFLKARPDDRPFILSRSGNTGMARHAAIWHGDSMSNDHWLRMAVPVTLNLSLSGVPFNGPDLGGFGGDTTPRLLTDYFKACFLFPFCRNHTALNTARQEPWAFGRETLRVLRSYIRNRYRLRPYLYNLFVRQEENGEAILRPMFYDFHTRGEPDFRYTDDQFMVGPALLQAPLLDERRSRKLTLPNGRWWNFMTSRWIEGGRTIHVTPKGDATPLYGRAGHSVLMEPESPKTHHWRGTAFDVHLFLEPGARGVVRGEAVTDDGASFRYREGERTRVAYTAKTDGETVSITTRTLQNGFGPLDLGFVLYGRFRAVTVNRKKVAPERVRVVLAGATQHLTRVSA